MPRKQRVATNVVWNFMLVRRHKDLLVRLPDTLQKLLIRGHNIIGTSRSKEKLSRVQNGEAGRRDIGGAFPERKFSFPIQIRVWHQRSDFVVPGFQIVAQSLVVVDTEDRSAVVRISAIGPEEIAHVLALDLIHDFARHFAWRDDAGAELKHAGRAFLTRKEIEAGVFRN